MLPIGVTSPWTLRKVSRFSVLIIQESSEHSMQTPQRRDVDENGVSTWVRLSERAFLTWKLYSNVAGGVISAGICVPPSFLVKTYTGGAYLCHCHGCNPCKNKSLHPQQYECTILTLKVPLREVPRGVAQERNTTRTSMKYLHICLEL